MRNRDYKIKKRSKEERAMKVHSRGINGNQVRVARWQRFLDQLADKLGKGKFENLLSDWTLEFCCFKEELCLPEILTKHIKGKLFRKWYPISMLDSWEEVIKRDNKNFPIESWCKMTEEEKINTLIVKLIDIFQKEERSTKECRYFENEETTRILENPNLPKEIRECYEGLSGGYGEWLCLWDPALKKLAEKKRD